jgi:S-adenosylmethionine decarboxylase
MEEVLPRPTPIVQHFLKGLHIIANLQSAENGKLELSKAFRTFLDEVIQDTQLNKVGEAYHDFEGGGFTAVVCLAESHLSIHTWPNLQYITFDIFLSNFTQDNSHKAQGIYQEVIRFFDAKVLYENQLQR